MRAAKGKKSNVFPGRFRSVVLGLLLTLPAWLQAQEAPAPAQLPRGTILDTVVCRQSPGQTYALYLPSTYSSQQQWPIVYLFDPGARGRVALEHFQAGAEQYGYILLCSNNSRNGSWQYTYEAAEAMSQDARTRFSIDPQRVYTGGFSGGARAAAAVAVMTGNVAGVIGCGAGLSGLPEHQPKASASFVYVGIVGKGDMNYLEMEALQQQWEKLGFPHRRLVFEGGHDWPPAEVATKALGWLQLQAMQKAIIPNRQPWMDSLYGQDLSAARQWVQNGDLYTAVEAYQQLGQDFKESKQVAPLLQRADSLRGTPAYRQAKQQREQLRTREIAVRNEITQAYRDIVAINTLPGRDTLNTDWWRSLSRNLHQWQKSNVSEEQWMAKRLEDQLWRMCAEQGSQYLQTKEYRSAEISFRIWSLTQPESMYPFYQLAAVYAATGRNREAIRHLEMAVEKGLSKARSIESNPVFNGLRGENRYRKLLAKLQQTRL